jgi:hypothetical protein
MGVYVQRPKVIKPFNGDNLRMFIASWTSGCPWQTFLAKSFPFRKGQEPTLEWST